ncbi:MAG TPA: hypothetical protein VHG53_02540 [Candidatus Limnocylindria bacterium]|nr:hypothetical protein [Candidatus Limnocylindria bacterium]
MDAGRQDGDEDIGLTKSGPLRITGAVLALIAGAIHFALAMSDLIPGESTHGILFAAMGLGCLGAAALLFVRQMELDVLVAVYAVGLIGSYVFTRGSLPIEAIGLITQAAQAGLVGVAVTLARRGG